MEEQNKPQIPSFKESPKPQLKIKGLASSLSLIERLKQFKKKDLAFILAGLGVLFMAPLAEHFLMSPDSGQGAFKEGWGFRGGEFGKGGSPYEGGLSGLAPGSLVGAGGDIITPLNVRDPSALVMGPGATQQPPAGAPPKEDKKEDWKTALRDAATAGAKEATKKASLPVPKIPLSAGGLRGLGAASGGGGGSYSLPPISASNVPNQAAGRDLLNVRPASGYRGAAGARGPGKGGGGMEDLKKAAAAAGSDMNRPGPAYTALEQAASRDLSGNVSQGGLGGQKGGDDKSSSQSQDKGSKSAGESLEFMRLKAEQDKSIDLKWKLKEKQAMLWPNLQEKLLEEAVMTPFKKISAGVADLVGSIGGSAASEDIWECSDGFKVKRSKVVPCTEDLEGKKPYCRTGTTIFERVGGGNKEHPNCSLKPGGEESSGPTEDRRGVRDIPRPRDPTRGDSEVGATSRAADICAQTEQIATAPRDVPGQTPGTAVNYDLNQRTWGNTYRASRSVSESAYALDGTGAIQACKGNNLLSGAAPEEGSIIARLNRANGILTSAAAAVSTVAANAGSVNQTLSAQVETEARNILTALGTNPMTAANVTAARAAMGRLEALIADQGLGTKLTNAQSSYQPYGGDNSPLKGLREFLARAGSLIKSGKEKLMGDGSPGNPGAFGMLTTAGRDNSQMGDRAQALQGYNQDLTREAQDLRRRYREAERLNRDQQEALEILERALDPTNGNVKKSLVYAKYSLDGQVASGGQAPIQAEQGMPLGPKDTDAGFVGKSKAILGQLGDGAADPAPDKVTAAKNSFGEIAGDDAKKARAIHKTLVPVPISAAGQVPSQVAPLLYNP